MLEKLINKKVVIAIGEPWNFESDAGENILNGTINLVSNESEIEWLRCDVSPFDFEGQEIKSVVAVHRYAHQSFQSLLDGEQVICNFMYESTGKELSAQQVSEIILKKIQINFLIGSIQLIPDE